MATGLPVLADLKAFVRAADSGTEDALLEQLLDRALGAAQSFLSEPITAIPQTFLIFGTGEPRRTIVLPVADIDLTQPVTVTGRSGTTVPSTQYAVIADMGIVARTDCLLFCDWPYTVSLTWGLSARPDFTVAAAPVVGQAILDIAADLFQRRNPVASVESAGGGVSAQYFVKLGASGLPARAEAALQPFRRVAA